MHQLMKQTFLPGCLSFLARMKTFQDRLHRRLSIVYKVAALAYIYPSGAVVWVLLFSF